MSEVCVCVCMHACVFMCMCVCITACMCMYVNNKEREREREREREKESVCFTMHANLWFYKICLRFSDIMGSSATKFLNAHYNFFIINSNTVVEHKIIHRAKVHRTTHIFVLLCLWTHSPDLGLMRATLRMVSFSPSKYARSLLHSKQRKEDDSSINSCLLYTSPSPRDSGISRMPSSA